MRRKFVDWNLLLLTILCVLALMGGLRQEATHAATRGTTAGAAQARCSINADCVEAICVDALCVSSAPECLTDADCGLHGVCTHDQKCYRLR